MKGMLFRLFRSLIRSTKFRKEDIKSILVIRMNRIGDMIYTIPLVRTLRNEFPEATITVLAENTNAEVIQCQPYIDRVLIYKRGSGILRNTITNIMRTLQGADFDLAIGVKGGFSTFLATAALLSGAKYRTGYKSLKGCFRDRFYNLPVQPIEFSSHHQADACLHLLHAVGVKKEIRDISLIIPDRFMDAAADFLRAKGLKQKERLVVFNVSSNREKSTWRSDNFVALGKYLIHNYRCSCIITGVSSDNEKASVICGEIGEGAYYYKTLSVMDFAAVASISNLLVTGDGGASHIGAAARTLVICLFGEANPVVWRPWGADHIVLRMRDGDAKSIAVQDVIAAMEANEQIMKALSLQ